jgi:hypothetical protein
MPNKQVSSSSTLKSIPAITKPFFITRPIKPIKKEAIEFIVADLSNSKVTVKHSANASSARDY